MRKQSHRSSKNAKEFCWCPLFPNAYWVLLKRSWCNTVITLFQPVAGIQFKISTYLQQQKNHINQCKHEIWISTEYKSKSRFACHSNLLLFISCPASQHVWKLELYSPVLFCIIIILICALFYTVTVAIYWNHEK